MVETGRRPDRRRITEAELLGALRTALAEEGIWLQQTVTSHERRDDLTLVTIDFTWVDGETGETLGPTTFIGYGSGPGDGAEARSLAATERNFIRHALLLGSDDAWWLDAHPGRDRDGRRSAGVPALGLD